MRFVVFKPVLVALFLAAFLGAVAPGEPPQKLKIASITVQPSLPVLGPDHVTVLNAYGGLTTASDEHSTILPPGIFPGQTDYLVLLASRTELAPIESGLVFLRSTELPDKKGQWSLDFAQPYGQFAPTAPAGGQNGSVFATAMAHNLCPTTAPDPTFDLNYAAPGTVIVDPTNPGIWGSENLIMVYEGTNRCIGISTANNGKNNFYSTIGIATSSDFGLSWPVYRANYAELPLINQTEGPDAPAGAWGDNVCTGAYCASVHGFQFPPQYGRYAVSGPVVTVQQAMNQLSNGLAGNVGDSEPAAFVDDLHGLPVYAYVVHTYLPGPTPGPFAADSPLYLEFPEVASDLSVSQIELNGGTERLKAKKWYNGSFSALGLGEDGGGQESPVFTNIAATTEQYNHCLAPNQARSSGSISYSMATHEFILFFVCLSPTDPVHEKGYPSGNPGGGAWFYATIDADQYDLSHQEQWSTPSEVINSWSIFAQNGGCVKNFNGWYPTLMSLNAGPGHLNTFGYVFYMDGCTDLATTGGRTYSTREFSMQLQ